MAQAKRGANCAPVTTYGQRARYALHTACTFDTGPGLDRFARLEDLARYAASSGRWADHAAVLQWFGGRWVPL